MRVFIYVFIILSFLLSAAHFFRMGWLVISLVNFALPFFLFVKKSYSARLLQLFLLLISAEWFRTLYLSVSYRLETGLPWIRLAIILSIVALFTIATALLIQHPSMKKKFGLK